MRRFWLGVAVAVAFACGDSGGSNGTGDAGSNGANGSNGGGADAGVPDSGATPFPTPEWARDAVVYEIFVRQFSEEGTLDAVTARVGELEELGVNTLWLMPIQPIGAVNRKGTLGSPYSVADYTAVDPATGTLEDFDELVAAVHAEGMHIILDWVANHSAFDNPWAVEHPEWYRRDSEGNLLHPEGTDWTDVADLTYEVPDQRRAMIDAMRFWVEEHDIDGFRCDVAGLVPESFWQAAIAELRTVKPIVMLAEASGPRMHDIGFDWTYPWQEYEQTVDVFGGEWVADWIQETRQQISRIAPGLRVRYSTNHDETAFQGTPLELFDGIEGAEAAFVLVTSASGIPLLYNGQEVASSDNTSLFEKDPIDFDQHPEVRAFYTQFLSMYADSHALRAGETTFPAPDERDVAIVERTSAQQRVVVVVNVRDRTRTVSLPASVADQSYTDLMSGDPVDLEGRLELPPYGYLVLEAN